jgi:hypothetical protein
MDNVQKHNNFTASLVKEMSGGSLYVIASTYCINKTVLCPRSTHNDASAYCINKTVLCPRSTHNDEEVLTSLDR